MYRLDSQDERALWKTSVVSTLMNKYFLTGGKQTEGAWTGTEISDRWISAQDAESWRNCVWHIFRFLPDCTCVHFAANPLSLRFIGP